MSNILNYKSYYTEVEYDKEAGVLFGKIEGIKDLVTFQSESAADIEKEFHNAVDEYLAICEELGKEPNKMYNGVFNVRTTPEIHRKLAYYAKNHKCKLNEAVNEAFEKLLLTDERNMSYRLSNLSQISNLGSSFGIIRAKAEENQ